MAILTFKKYYKEIIIAPKRLSLKGTITNTESMQLPIYKAALLSDSLKICH